MFWKICFYSHTHTHMDPKSDVESTGNVTTPGFAKKEMALVQSAPMNQSLAQFKESYNFAHICEEFEVQRDIDFVYDEFHSHAGLYPFLDIPAMWGYCIIHF
jgi:hypothetical protein